MNYLSLFSGIEAASEAWKEPLGWTCVGVAEIEPYPCKLLAQRHPGVRNLGDITKITEDDIIMLGRIDLVVFGSPCQDLSVAGNRKGLAGARSGLFFKALAIVTHARVWGGCRFALWENVPGAFTSSEGRDFAAVVDALSGLDIGTTVVPPKGWGNEGCAVGEEAMVEWSTLDAQWFGVAQRRRRVFALADFGDWASRPPILLEPESLRGDFAPSRSSRKDVAGTLTSRVRSGGLGTDFECDGGLVAELGTVLAFGGNNQAGAIDVSTALNASGTASGRLDFESETFVVCATGEVTHALNTANNGKGSSEDGTGRDVPTIAYMPSNVLHPDGTKTEYFAERDVCNALHCSVVNGNKAPLIAFQTRGTNLHVDDDIFGTLGTNCDRAGGSAPCIAFNARQDPDAWIEHTGPLDTDGTTQAVAFQSSQSGVLQAIRVRRLTPLECERLQAFRDGHTAIVIGKKPAADGPRYKALGNSMCVNVMRWIGEQIDFVQEFC